MTEGFATIEAGTLAFAHHGDRYTFDDVQFLPPPLQQPRMPVWVSAMPVWVSAMTRNERTLGRAGRWDGVLLGAMSAGGGNDVLPTEAVAEVAARPDAHVGPPWLEGFRDELPPCEVFCRFLTR